MKKLLSIFLIVFAMGLFAQEKATLYVARTSALGAAINFKYFIGDQYIGKFKAGKYIKLELDAGEHLIWVRSENNAFAEVTVEAGKTYALQAVPKMGGMKARVELRGIYESDEWGMDKQLEKVRKLIKKKDPETFDSAEVEEQLAKMQDKIPEWMAEYENELKGTEKVIQLDTEFSLD